MSVKGTSSLIKLEIEQIDKLLEKYEDLLRDCVDKKPDLVKMTAAASVLHSFYNGIEGVFLTISKRIDNLVPSGPQWHRDLLTSMAKDTGSRRAVITSELKNILADYLAFRHFYRHAYSFPSTGMK